MNIKLRPKRPDIWPTSAWLALDRYVDIRKLVALRVAQQTRRAAVVQSAVVGVNIPDEATMPPKKSRVGIETTKGANAVPIAYERGWIGKATIISLNLVYLSQEISCVDAVIPMKPTVETMAPTKPWMSISPPARTTIRNNGMEFAITNITVNRGFLLRSG